MAQKTLSYGSSGDEVKKLQKSLNNMGYSLEVDGKFGSETQKAVKAYQQKNGLSVDGIVGTNTWGSLNKNTEKLIEAEKSTSKSTTRTADRVTKPIEAQRPAYEKSEAVINAEKNLSEWESNKPSGYESKYSEQIENILNDILNREDFSYNMNADPLYNQYKEQYIQNGKRAMLDTMANATALTGGYGSSYAVAAGNQAYNDYLSGLNNIALDLYDRAYALYKEKGNGLFDEMSLLNALEEGEYSKHQQSVDEYFKNGEYLLDKLSSMSDAEYESFLQELEAFESDRAYNYQKYLDELEQQNFYDELSYNEKKFNEEMAFKKAEAQRDQANEDRAYNLSLAKQKASSSSASSSKSSKGVATYLSESSVYPQSFEHFVKMTGMSNIMTKAEFNLRDKAKNEYGSYKNYLKEMYKKYG